MRDVFLLFDFDGEIWDCPIHVDPIALAGTAQTPDDESRPGATETAISG
jgi:hypothetical protein